MALAGIIINLKTYKLKNILTGIVQNANLKTGFWVALTTKGFVCVSLCKEGGQGYPDVLKII